MIPRVYDLENGPFLGGLSLKMGHPDFFLATRLSESGPFKELSSVLAAAYQLGMANYGKEYHYEQWWELFFDVPKDNYIAMLYHSHNTMMGTLDNLLNVPRHIHHNIHNIWEYQKPSVGQIRKAEFEIETELKEYTNAPPVNPPYVFLKQSNLVQWKSSIAFAKSKGGNLVFGPYELDGYKAMDGMFLQEIESSIITEFKAPKIAPRDLEITYLNLGAQFLTSGLYLLNIIHDSAVLARAQKIEEEKANKKKPKEETKEHS